MNGSRLRFVGLLFILVFLLPGIAVAHDVATTSARQIKHGQSIGRVRLGMTLQEVRKVLGHPRAVIKRGEHGGKRYVELEWNYGSWNVGFIVNGRRYRAVLVGTARARYRTPEGLGVGSSRRDILRRFPRARERITGFGRGELVHRLLDGRETAFMFAGDEPDTLAVEVRERGVTG